MSSVTSPAPVSALHQILEWSTSRPAWQRDALRRIILNGGISQTDEEDLLRLCLTEHGADSCADPALAARPLEPSHLPPGPNSTDSVSLVSVGGLRFVNRIPEEQVLSFGTAPGLTIVYGNNGVGKSGYARVIKKACRSRGSAPTIRPDAYAPSALGPATGRITFSVAGVNESADWQDGEAADSRLANVFVFDSATAENYLGEDGPATFTPFGLDVLPKLARTCDSISGKLQREIDELTRVCGITARSWKYSVTTGVGRLLSTISAKTTRSQVDTLAVLSDNELKRLQVIADALRSDPKMKAKETRASAARVRQLAAKVASADEALSEEAVNNIRTLADEAMNAAAIAKSFSEGRFDKGYLPKTGGTIWRNLWEAARTYSENDAYAGEAYPVISAGGRCVLCQQELDALASERMRAFEEFCKDQSQLLAGEAAKRLGDATVSILTLQEMGPNIEKTEADLGGLSPVDLCGLRVYVQCADARLTAVKNNLQTGDWKTLTVLPVGPGALLDSHAATLDERANLEESADDPIARQKLGAEMEELTDRKGLGIVAQEVYEQIDRHQRVAQLERCKKDALTAQITSKSTALTKTLVTEAFCTKFKDEVRKLSLVTLPVKLAESEGKKGEKKFGLRLDKAPSAKVKDIASEGEQRCAALAAFLAELSLASHSSALVFDDPVSSLDHSFRGKTARRLAEEGKSRQVIVFTHDAVFLNDLLACAEEFGVAASCRHLEWNGVSPGQCQEGLPWDCKSPADRLDKLDKLQRHLAGTWSPMPSEENTSEMRHAYSWLRATIERIVEKVVFADVVFRFRTYVNLGNLREVVGFQASECVELQRIFQRCCDVTDAHDAAAGKLAAPPFPDELAEDIKATKSVLAAIKDRRKVMKAS